MRALALGAGLLLVLSQQFSGISDRFRKISDVAAANPKYLTAFSSNLLTNFVSSNLLIVPAAPRDERRDEMRRKTNFATFRRIKT